MSILEAIFRFFAAETDEFALSAWTDLPEKDCITC